MNRKTHQIAILVMILIAAIAAGCGIRTGNTTDNPGPDADGLLGVEWTLTAINGAAPLESSTTTLTLENGEAGGSAGCNSYGGKYLVQGRKLSFEELFNTEMACEAPAGIMEQEMNFLQTLRQTASFEVDGSRLELRNAAGEASLVFER